MRSLVISGGGSKSAHSVGILQHLLGDLEIKYEAIHGVSAGAINAAYLGQWKFGQEKQAIRAMTDLWLKLDTSLIYKSWRIFGKIASFWKNSLFNSSPLRKLLRDNISLSRIRSTGKIVTVGVLNLSSGKYHTIDQTNDNFIDYVIASSSFPGALEAIKINGDYYGDGGAKTISPFQASIDYGASSIDALITSPKTRVSHWISKPNTSDILRRTIDLSFDKILSNDIEKLEMNNKLARAGVASKRYIPLTVIRPQFNLIEDLLDFSPYKIKEMMQKGYDDAKSAYNNTVSI
jgi:NTE family protein